MKRDELLLVLQAVRDGSIDDLEAMKRLSTHVGFEDIADSRIDLEREERCGHPEVIYAASKSVEQIIPIARLLLERQGLAFATRCDPEKAEGVMKAIEGGSYDPVARTLLFGRPRERRRELEIVVVSAGTSDLPVAQEAVRTLEAMGARPYVLRDVGVAGLHRLLAELPRLRQADLLIVVAGMEGALASVVGGLVAAPVIAVPTSVGYGAALGGLTPLFGMLTSCASGTTVVNIDNGFGAAMAALSLLNVIERRLDRGAGTTDDGTRSS